MEIAIVAPRSYKSSLTSHRIRRGRKLEQNRLFFEKTDTRGIGFRLGNIFSSERNERATRKHISKTNGLAHRDLEIFNLHNLLT